MIRDDWGTEDRRKDVGGVVGLRGMLWAPLSRTFHLIPYPGHTDETSFLVPLSLLTADCGMPSPSSSSSDSSSLSLISSAVDRLLAFCSSTRRCTMRFFLPLRFR